MIDTNPAKALEAGSSPYSDENKGAISALLNRLGGYQAVFNALSVAAVPSPTGLGLSPMAFAHNLLVHHAEYLASPTPAAEGAEPVAEADITFAKIRSSEVCFGLGWQAGYESAMKGQEGECMTQALDRQRDGIVGLLSAPPSPPVAGVERACYLMSEPHLSGHRVVLGFETLQEAQNAHTALAKLIVEARK